jgi:hypothetical protein
MILLLTTAGDGHANLIEELLCERGADVVRLDPGHFPARASVSLAYSVTGPGSYTLSAGGQAVDLNGVTAVWYPRPQLPSLHAEITDPTMRKLVQEECNLFMEDVWNCLDCLWLPGPPQVTQRAMRKALQLRIAAALGFELPATLFTNNPPDFLEFYRRHNGNIISKPAELSFSGLLGDRCYRYTEVVSRREVAYAGAVRYCPIIFQAYVPKRVELRVTVVGRRVFAGEIHSQASNHTRHDWRRYDFFQTVHQPHELPQEIAQRCVRLVEELGLCYGAIDMVLTPDGRYVFLEINPTGEYLWLERVTGLPISEAFCDLLMSGAPGRRACPSWFKPDVEIGHE